MPMKRVVKIPPLDEWDHLLVVIDKPVTDEDYKELLTKATLLGALRDHRLTRQGIQMESESGPDDFAHTVTGIQVAAHLAEKFKELYESPAVWQKRVHLYEYSTVGELKQLMGDISESIQTLKHTEALQEVNRALAYLQVNFPVRLKQLREGELSGMTNPDQTIPVVPADDNGQCPAGYVWSARVGGCVQLQDGTAQLGFDTSKGGNLASSDLRKARSLTGRRQFMPEGTDVQLDQGGFDRLHPDNYGKPNRAMGNAGIETSDRNIDTEQMPGGSRVNDVTVPTRSRPTEALREGELSGMGNPDKEIEVVAADANGQCRAGWMYSARLGGCIRIADGTASTAFDTSKDGNTAASDLRKARASTGRRQFTPEGTDVQVDQANMNRRHPDNYGTPNRAMGNPDAIEVSDKNIDTEQMPGGNRVNFVAVPTRMRPSEAYSSLSEGELSGMANPDAVLRGVDPDDKGQCPRGTMFSAMVGKCIPLSADQQADALRGNRTQHLPEGTVTRMGKTYGIDNSDKPNLAMGYTGRPLAAFEDEGPLNLSRHYAVCMFMLREASYSYYTSMHASRRFCFYPFEGKQDGYINAKGELAHMAFPLLTEQDEQALKDWQQTEEADFNEKTGMDTAYEKDLKLRLSYRNPLTELINRGRTDSQIQHILEQRAGLPRRTVNSLMNDVRMLRRIQPAPTQKHRVLVKMGSTEDSPNEPMHFSSRKPCPEGTRWDSHLGKCVPWIKGDTMDPRLADRIQGLGAPS